VNANDKNANDAVLADADLDATRGGLQVPSDLKLLVDRWRDPPIFPPRPRPAWPYVPPSAQEVIDWLRRRQTTT
jgi:hypothetical protein